MILNPPLFPVGKDPVSEYTINIMWTRDSDLDNRAGRTFEPNHFVPIVKIQSLVSREPEEYTKCMGEKRSLSQSPVKKTNTTKSNVKYQKRQKTPIIGNQTKISSCFKHPQPGDVHKDEHSDIQMMKVGQKWAEQIFC